MSCFCISCSKPAVCKHFPIRQHPPGEEAWLHKLCHWLKGLYSHPLSLLRHTSSIFFHPLAHQVWEAGIISPRAIAPMTAPPQMPQYTIKPAAARCNSSPPPSLTFNTLFKGTAPTQMSNSRDTNWVWDPQGTQNPSRLHFFEILWVRDTE